MGLGGAFKALILFIYRCSRSLILLATLGFLVHYWALKLKSVYGQNRKVIDIIYWRDPKRSGAALAAILLIFFALTRYSVISVFAYLGLGILTVTLNFRIYKAVQASIQKTDQKHPFKNYLEKDLTIPQDKLRQQVDLFIRHLDELLQHLRRLLLVEDIFDTIKFALLLWTFTYIGQWFSAMTLAILSILLLFSVPKVYEMYQPQIDQNYKMVYSKIEPIVKQIQDKVPALKQKKI